MQFVDIEAFIAQLLSMNAHFQLNSLFFRESFAHKYQKSV